jgi:hypothetical protein
MIAHAQPGLKKTYDRYAYVEEKRRGFGLWEAHCGASCSNVPRMWLRST